MWSDKESEIDFLNFNETAQSIKDLITEKDLMPISVGIFGDWGAGKSTILELTKKSLESDEQEYIQVHFDAWMFQGYDDAKAALLETIASKLIKQAESDKGLTQKAKEFAGRVDKIRLMGLLMDGGSALAGIPTGGGFQKIFGLLSDDEDDDIDAIGIQRSLKSFNLLNPIHRTRDGLEALEVLKNDAIDRPFIVLLDLNMPRMNGMEFLSAIRSDPNLSDIVVFVLTTSQLDEEISAAYKKNIAGYIVKSSSNQDYKQLIRFLENYWNLVELPKC